jgi:hypothetical protein
MILAQDTATGVALVPYGRGARVDADHYAAHADASLIVLCVNAHEELVAALKAARPVLASALRYGAPDFMDDAGVAEHHTIKQIDAALARASGVGEGHS